MTRTKRLSEADRIASHVRQPMSWERLRDYVDLQTGGELGCIELDILTDMVEARVKK
jgi:hypothetical protein